MEHWRGERERVEKATSKRQKHKQAKKVGGRSHNVDFKKGEINPLRKGRIRLV